MGEVIGMGRMLYSIVEEEEVVANIVSKSLLSK
jgi:hypothetical protein